MEEVKATLKGAPIGRLKALPLVNLIRGKSADEACRILTVHHQKVAPLLYKLIQSALSNAQQKKTIDLDKLYVKEIFVNQGPHRKSFIPRARGRASRILKKSSHFSVVLRER